ncbi:LytTR family DNA-binding domain-containing protein [Flammeovirgaceae bacterium SG7u.111]|nr:LytTR family DNA-binding domain-containing protein [Flammeovirgaceae bacterium SG7u.132]WPO36092.1 LytTR family DNA-binding domain-containing protein [Flammeovirgaceae bacterium SG7u.111]
MKIVILEDEEHNARLLKGMLAGIRPDWEVIEELDSVKSAVAWFSSNLAPDLVFMDIQLTDGVCFSIFDQVQFESMVVFTTAYDQYAIQAFEVNSVDYLLKPIKTEKLLNAILKFEKLHQQTSTEFSKTDFQELASAIRSGEKKFRKRFLVAGATGYSKLETNDIAYFYTENRLTYAVDFKGKKHVLDFTIEKIEEQVDPEQFYRANRSVILNSDAVQKIENYFGGKLIVKLISPLTEPVTVSRLRATSFKNWLDA